MLYSVPPFNVIFGPSTIEFWNSFKEFFSNKSQFFKKIDDSFKANLDLKKALVDKVNELKSSDDWENTSKEIQSLQQEWKKIGKVPMKDKDSIFKEFKDACDTFYERMRVEDKDTIKLHEDNLEKKLSTCEAIEKLLDNKEFDLECGDGEEGLLRKAEKQLNLKLQEHKELLTLPEAQKYLMMALIIVGENIDKNEKEKEIDLIFNEIDEELSKLENKLIEGSNKNA